MYTIYLVTNLVNKKVYVGQTSKLPTRRRWSEHLTAARCGRKQPIHAAIRKHGESNFIFLELTTGANKVGADTLERFWISRFNSTDRTLGYNLTEGGGGLSGHKLSEEHRAKIGVANKGRKRTPEMIAKMKARNLGKHPSPETRQKMSASGRGRKMSQEAVAKTAAALRGRKFSDEHRKKLSAAKKGRPTSPNALPAAWAANRGRPLSPEHKAAVSAGQKRRWEKSRSQQCEK